MPDLLVLAELNPDVVVGVADPDIAFGQTERLVERATITLGSSGAITASAAAAQGVDVAICGLVGTDAVGDLTIDLLRAQGIDTSAVRRSDTPTGMTIVLSRPDGDRALLTYPGTMAVFTAGEVPDEALRAARHVHVSSYYLQRALQVGLPALLAGVRDRGGTTSLDPGWDPGEHWRSVLDVLPAVDVFLPNGQECTRIHGAADPLDAAYGLAGDRTVAVKLGADGAAAVTRDVARVAHIDPVIPVDTTGAGDNFDAGYLAAWLDGAGPDAALRRAVASGTVSVGGFGGTGRMATRAEAIDLAAAVRVERHERIEVAP